jgi:hypothetical protein
MHWNCKFSLFFILLIPIPRKILNNYLAVLTTNVVLFLQFSHFHKVLEVLLGVSVHKYPLAIINSPSSS